MKELEDYEERYGHIPSTQKEILIYLKDNLKINEKKLIANENHINSLKWEEININLPIVPKPTPRARYNFKTNHFYVKGAGKNKKIIEKFIDDVGIIYTRTILYVRTYQPTPTSSMSNHEIYLAEKGLLCPIQNPDWDNLGKTYSDMIQDILLLNDNIVQKGIVEKFFSVRPRVEIYIEYQDNFDSKFNSRKIVTSTAYKKLDLPTQILDIC